MNVRPFDSTVEYLRDLRDNAIYRARDLKIHRMKGVPFYVDMARRANRNLIREMHRSNVLKRDLT